MTSFTLSISGYLDETTDDFAKSKFEDFIASQLEDLGFNDIEVTLKETEQK